MAVAEVVGAKLGVPITRSVVRGVYKAWSIVQHIRMLSRAHVL